MKTRIEQIQHYIEDLFCEEEPHIDENPAIRKIHIPAHVGKMLYLFALIHSPKKVLEIGTLAGYSSLWLARALPDAQITTLDNNESHFQIAKENIQRAGRQDQITPLLGDAKKTLQEMMQNKQKFDLIFLDADKVNYPHYLELLIQLSHPGSIIITDNVIPKRGEILKPDLRDQDALSIYRYNGLLAEHPRLKTTLFPTIAREGTHLDALAVSYVS